MNYGAALCRAGRMADGLAAMRIAARINPEYAHAHVNIAAIIFEFGDYAGAEAGFRQAITINPGLAEAHTGLANALRAQGRFRESLVEFRLGHELGQSRPDWKFPSAEWVKETEQAVALDGKLTAVIAATAQASPEERAALAGFALEWKNRPDLAVRLYAEAFAADPKLADPLGLHHYNAACAAARMAGAGDTPADARAEYRGRAKAFLAAKLAAVTKLAEQPAARQQLAQTLRHWQSDTDLVAVRDEVAVAKLPDAEQAEWQKFWADVAALLRRAEGQSK